jgi:hypothetical protein
MQSSKVAANRVQKMIDVLSPRIDALDVDARRSLEASMAVDFADHFAYQEEQARAHASGLLSVDEAQIVYAALGEVGSDANGGWSVSTDLATKGTVTKLIGELLSRRIAR